MSEHHKDHPEYAELGIFAGYGETEPHSIHKSPEWYFSIAGEWNLAIGINPRDEDFFGKVMRKTTRLLMEATGWAWHSCGETEHDNSHSHKCTKCKHEFVHSLSSLACEACHICPSCGTSKNWDIYKHIKHKPDPLEELIEILRATGNW